MQGLGVHIHWLASVGAGHVLWLPPGLRWRFAPATLALEERCPKESREGG